MPQQSTKPQPTKTAGGSSASAGPSVHRPPSTVLLLNQTFYPDVMATGQYLSELATGLAERGHEVSVVTSRRAYDQPGKLFPKRETWRGVNIYRVACTGFGKGAKWRRALDFASFMVSCTFRLLFLRRHDVVIALTSPPLISFLGALISRIRGSRFCYWVMDFNPDEAIAAGWLRPGSLAANVLERLSRFSLHQASRVFALDRFMRDRIVTKGMDSEKIRIVPPWSHDDDVRFDPIGRDRFRKRHDIQDKFVVMYSGNHSPCHPLDTLLQAAEILQNQAQVLFCFVGGGSEWSKIIPASNVLRLPYQPLAELSASLSAADLHVVVMGDPFVGLVHPCKIYNILSVGAPVLYIGPEPSHVSDILDSPSLQQRRGGSFRHGDVEGVAKFISSLSQSVRRENRTPPAAPGNHAFAKTAQLSRLLVEIEQVQPRHPNMQPPTSELPPHP